ILGPPSLLGSRALLAAQKQGGYQKLRDAMMSDSPDISEDSIRGQAERVGLDWPRLQRDMDDPAIQARLQDNVRLARVLGIEGTPAFVVGEKLVVGSELTDLQSAVSAVSSSHTEADANAPAPAAPRQ
ncbi:MAG: DsbA family protein, partial [Nevskiales bacterium]